MVIKTNDLAIALQKVSSENIRGLSMEEGSSKFKLPGDLGYMSGGNVNVKVRSFPLHTLFLVPSPQFILSIFCFLFYHIGRVGRNNSTI